MRKVTGVQSSQQRSYSGGSGILVLLRLILPAFVFVSEAMAQTHEPPTGGDEIPNDVELSEMPLGTMLTFDRELLLPDGGRGLVFQDGVLVRTISNYFPPDEENEGELCTLRRPDESRSIPAGSVFTLTQRASAGNGLMILTSTGGTTLEITCRRGLDGRGIGYIGSAGTLARSLGWDTITLRDPDPPPYAHTLLAESSLRSLRPGSLAWEIGDPSLPSWARAPYPFPSAVTLSIDGEELGRCLARTVLSHTRTPSIDRSHMSRDYDATAFLSYLQGAPRIEPFTTGREEALRGWVSRQPDASITPVSILRASLEMHSGNLWNALLAVHELLRNEARWFDRDRYHYASSYAHETDFFRRFIDLRGDLRERDPARFTGDHPGTWYRIFGVMLGLLDWQDESLWNSHFPRHEPEERIGTACPGLSATEDMILGLGGFWAELLVTGLEASKLYGVPDDVGVLAGIPAEGSEDDLRKGEYDRAAVAAGIAMIRSLYALNEGNPHSTSDCDDPALYLDEFEVSPPPTDLGGEESIRGAMRSRI